MAHISIRNLTVEFKIYGSSSRSLKRQILTQATGGLIKQGDNNVITVKAIDDISLEISDGDRVGLLGHNGAGKTTLLRTIAGIYKPTGGVIEIEGSVGALLDPAAGLDLEATGRENIYLRGYVLGMNRREINEQIAAIADFGELGNFLELPVKTYSTGMFSRLGFAISTAIKPDILLIDEAIGAGDASFQIKAKQRTDETIGRARLLLLSSHSTELVDGYCNRKVVFEHGRIISDTRVDARSFSEAASHDGNVEGNVAG